MKVNVATLESKTKPCYDMYVHLGSLSISKTVIINRKQQIIDTNTRCTVALACGRYIQASQSAYISAYKNTLINCITFLLDINLSCSSLNANIDALIPTKNVLCLVNTL